MSEETKMPDSVKADLKALILEAMQEMNLGQANKQADPKADEKPPSRHDLLDKFEHAALHIVQNGEASIQSVLARVLALEENAGIGSTPEKPVYGNDGKLVVSQ